MNVLIFKVIAIPLILITSSLGAVFSARIASFRERDRIFSLGNAFAGGIFLGTGMLHMLPDAHDGIKLLWNKHDLPLVALFACCGFLIILFIQKVLLYEIGFVDGPAGGTKGRTFSPHVLMVSLSVHSLIAGVALGTEVDVRKVIILLIAILAYKISAVFALEVNLHRSGLHENPHFKKVHSLFGFMTPIGILMGLAVMAILAGPPRHMVTLAVDSLTAGSFLYIALADIIEEEFMEPKDRFFKFALVAFGFVVMAAITVQM
jgi:zinc transporter 1/2/3